MTPYGIVYCYKNVINQKVYVGQTTQSLEKRHVEHVAAARDPRKRGYNCSFQRAIRTHGIHKFKKTVLFVAFDRDALDNAEIELIASYESLDKTKGYNLAYGGSKSGMHTEETKRKISEASKVLWTKPEHRALMSEVGKKNYRYLQTPESHIKSGLTRSGRPLTDKMKAAVSRLSHKPIIGIHRITGETLNFESIKSAQRAGFAGNTIRSNIRGQSVHCGQFIWRFA